MEEVEANAFEVQIESTPIVASDEAARDKLMKLPRSKLSQTKTGTTSTCMSQIVILHQMDPRILKLKPENKANCGPHSRKHYSRLAKTP